MNVHQCPFCHHPIKGVPIDVDLSPKQRKLFLMIMGAGPVGVGIDEIMETLFKGMSPISLRTCIHYINKSISPRHIKRQDNTYRFELKKVK